ncbi:MAG: hypothetical protein ACPGJU_00900 [Coraliomargarita sp.]
MSVKITEYDMKRLTWCLGQSVFRIQAEFNYCINNEPTILPYYDRLKGYPKPCGYRRKIWDILLKTTFRKIAGGPSGNRFEALGQILGLMDSMGKALDHYTEEDCDILDAALIEYGYTKAEFEQDFGRLEEPAEPILSSFSQMHAQIATEHPEGLADFTVGYASGLKLVFDPSTKFDPQKQDGRPAVTTFYFFFLIYGDYLKTVSSNRKIYQIAKMGYDENEMPYDLETFLTYCKRIGFTGRSYRRSKR